MKTEIARICVPTDFSDVSEHAIKYGAALARQHQAQLHLIHVLQDIHEKFDHPDFSKESTTVQQFLKSLEQGATEYLARLAANKAWSDLHVERVYLRGNPADAIVDYAQRNKIDLMVIGTQGRTGLKQMVLGSVAEKVVRLCPCPVLTVKYPQDRDFLISEEKLPGVE